jgi:sorting nexin-25
LKDEILLIEKECTALQLHMARTDWWCENLGLWRASITSAEVSLLLVFFKPEFSQEN